MVPRTGGGIQLRATFNPDEAIGFVYSYNNGRGKPEFLALNVPRSKANKVAGTMNFLANREVQHGQVVESN
jgi:hypothetical protein